MDNNNVFGVTLMKILVLQHIKCPSNGNKVTYMRLMYQFFISPLSLRRL
jgi:hypothetical protein